MHNYIIIYILFFLCSSSLKAYEFVIEPATKINKLIDFKASELCEVSKNTQIYLQNFPEDKFAVHKGTVLPIEISMQRVKDTLGFICTVYRQDVRENQQSRLHDINFIRQHFNFYRWTPDIVTAQKLARGSNNEVKRRLLNNIPNDKIFLTKYYTKLLDASEIKTAKYNHALYALPNDELNLSSDEAIKAKLKLTRFKYTRQDVIAGALKVEGLAKPLIWLTEEALHDVLLQGTGVVNVDGITRYFNVHRNNGIAYNYTLGKREQARYWYFIEVPGIMGYGEKQENKIAIKPQVTFAGNVKQLGLGKLFMVSYERDKENISRLGVLADQGGAFDNNLFQLDLLVDSYHGWADYHQANKQLPDYAKAWLMLLK